MTDEEWEDEVYRLKHLKEPFHYANNILGSPKWERGTDELYKRGMTPKQALLLWSTFPNVPKSLKRFYTAKELKSIEKYEIFPKNRRKNPSGDRFRKHLKKEFSSSEYENRDFDIESALYWFAHDYHSGQWSELYRVLSTSEFHPAPSHSSIEDEGSELGEMMYEELVRKFENTTNPTPNFDKGQQTLI
tara:strand:+ start:1927 stop:2493 length:567 start_codon:yes stop_codon:yes gene_type:complete